MRKKVIIIGAGISGLSAGIFAQKSGFETVLFEKHRISGGECTGWDRKGFHIDGCIHWLTGTKQGTDLNKLWNEVGALENIPVYQPENICSLEYNNKMYSFPRDFDSLKKCLIDISPQDLQEIENLFEYIHAFFDFPIPCEKPFDLMSCMDYIKLGKSMRPVGPVMMKLDKLSVGDYVMKFSSPVIREFLLSNLFPEFRASMLPLTLATILEGNGGRPSGGSRNFAKRMENTYIALGGKLLLNSEVDSIIIEKSKAIGIALSNGETHFADYIISSTDTHITLNRFLKNQYKNRYLDKMYANEKDYPLKSCVYLSIGVDAVLSDIPDDLSFSVRPFCLEGREVPEISVKQYQHEPDFSMTGKSIYIIYLNGNYAWWKEKQKSGEYTIEKERLGRQIVERLEEKFPLLKEKIQLLDIATPLTYERYCGAYKGAYMSFGITPKSIQQVDSGRIKKIENLYLAGQWLMPPGGLPAALLTGKWAIQRICKKEKVQFNKHAVT